MGVGSSSAPILAPSQLPFVSANQRVLILREGSIFVADLHPLATPLLERLKRLVALGQAGAIDDDEYRQLESVLLRELASGELA
jgi:hypothetical protein